MLVPSSTFPSQSLSTPSHTSYPSGALALSPRVLVAPPDAWLTKSASPQPGVATPVIATVRRRPVPSVVDFTSRPFGVSAVVYVAFGSSVVTWTETFWKNAGNGHFCSTTTTPLAVLAPVFRTSIVYVTGVT